MTFALWRPTHGTSLVTSGHDYYPFALEDADSQTGCLAHVAVELVDRLAILVGVRRFPDAWVMMFFVLCALTIDVSAWSLFVGLLLSLSVDFWTINLCVGNTCIIVL
jgi:hypothetical protein